MTTECGVDLFFPADHKLLHLLLQFFVEPIILLPHILHLLFQSTLAMLANQQIQHYY